MSKVKPEPRHFIIFYGLLGAEVTLFLNVVIIVICLFTSLPRFLLRLRNKWRVVSFTITSISR